MQQMVRHHHQYALNALLQQQAMENQAGLDGFTQAYLIGQQDARNGILGHLFGNVELVW